MIVKYSPRGYEFVTKTCNLNEDRKRIINKIEKSNGKYKNKSRYWYIYFLFVRKLIIETTNKEC